MQNKKHTHTHTHNLNVFRIFVRLSLFLRLDFNRFRIDGHQIHLVRLDVNQRSLLIAPRHTAEVEMPKLGQTRKYIVAKAGQPLARITVKGECGQIAQLLELVYLS